MKLAAALAIASLVPDEELNEDNIMPEAFNPKVAEVVAQAVKSHIARLAHGLSWQALLFP